MTNPGPSLRDRTELLSKYGSAPSGYSDDAWFAVAPDHVVGMTIDWGENANDVPANVGTCRCGVAFRVPRDGGGLAGALRREDEMNALIAAHRAEVMRQAPF